MIQVWAFKRGTFNFTPNPSSGYTVLVPFDTLTELKETMGNRLRGKVKKLAIVAHGDLDGLVQLDRLLMPSTLMNFQEEFHNLRWWLTPNAQVIFHSCKAGGGIDGDALLKGISRIIWGRTIVGFTINFLGGSEGMPTAAGTMLESTLSTRGMAVDKMTAPGARVGGENSSMYAKWAQNGRIIVVPLVEQIMGRAWNVSGSRTPSIGDAVRGGMFPAESQ